MGDEELHPELRRSQAPTVGALLPRRTRRETARTLPVEVLRAPDPPGDPRKAAAFLSGVAQTLALAQLLA